METTLSNCLQPSDPPPMGKLSYSTEELGMKSEGVKPCSSLIIITSPPFMLPPFKMMGLNIIEAGVVERGVSGDVIELLIYHQLGVKPSLTLHPFCIPGYVAGHSLTGGKPGESSSKVCLCFNGQAGCNEQ